MKTKLERVKEKEYQRQWEKRPEVMARRHAKRISPEGRAKQKAYVSKPKVKAHRKAYIKAYLSRHDVKQHHNAYMRLYMRDKRFSKLTDQQQKKAIYNLLQEMNGNSK